MTPVAVISRSQDVVVMLNSCVVADVEKLCAVVPLTDDGCRIWTRVRGRVLQPSSCGGELLHCTLHMQAVTCSDRGLPMSIPDFHTFYRYRLGCGCGCEEMHGMRKSFIL